MNNCNEGGAYHDLTEDKKIFFLEDIDLSLTYSYANYLTWLFDDRVELIKGKVFKMSPAPSPLHQEISANISSAIHNYLKDKPCKIYYAPFDVRFAKESKADEDIYTVLQPDICVICDPAKIDGRGCVGAPDIVIEILSPGNNRMELLNKYCIYEEFRVKEYWVVSPGDKTLLKYTLDVEGKYQPSKLFTLSEKVYSEVLPGFELDLDAVFE
ncbi:MAG: Uma2 family endonuclease, partial [Daejeonella sp.]|uniref:Uma2 family endonuclease n=1 Tax=Daejeonella sp. TaxID=2805397 RepID=UPI0027326290